MPDAQHVDHSSSLITLRFIDTKENPVNHLSTMSAPGRTVVQHSSHFQTEYLAFSGDRELGRVESETMQVGQEPILPSIRVINLGLHR